MTAHAHGVLAHVHVTGWAIDELPTGALRDLLADPEVRNAALFGAVFTDSGYGQNEPARAAAAHQYSEHAHWEPFVQAYVQWILDHDPPPWTDIESKKRVAFLMGIASHGLQDELFDSLFLYQVQQHDQGGQDNADPATDGFLAVDGLLEFWPQRWLPLDVLLELYAPISADITAEVIEDSVDLVVNVYVNDVLGPEIAKSLAAEHEPDLPWTRAHYLDPAIPGSLRSEIGPTLHYMEAIWARLHGGLEDADTVIATFPDGEHVLLGVDYTTPDSWVTFVYGVGVSDPDARFTLEQDDVGQALSFQKQGTRWGAQWTRLHRLLPSESFRAGAGYHAALQPECPRIDGGRTERSVLAFRAPCETPDDPACAPPQETDPQVEPAPVSEAEPGCSGAYGSPPAGGSTAVLMLLLGWAAALRARRRAEA